MTRLADRNPSAPAPAAPVPSHAAPPPGDRDQRDRFSRSLAAAAEGQAERPRPRADARHAAAHPAKPAMTGWAAPATQRRDDGGRRDDATSLPLAADPSPDASRGRDDAAPVAARPRADDRRAEQRADEPDARPDAADAAPPATAAPQQPQTPQPLGPAPPPAPPPSPGQVDQQALAMLDRIEAAMADLATRGVEAEVTVAFAAPAAPVAVATPGAMGPATAQAQRLLAEGAVIGRDSTGAVAVRLVGLNPHIAAAEAQRLAMQLRRGLEQRRITVAEVAFDPPRPHDMARVPATAKASRTQG